MHVTLKLNASATLCEESKRSISKLKKTEAAKQGFEADKETLLARLEQIEAICNSKLEEYRAQIHSPELMTKLLAYIETMKATEVYHIESRFFSVMRQLRSCKAVVSQLEYKSWKASEEPWQHITTNINSISYQDTIKALQCKLVLNTDKFEANLKHFVKFNLDLSFSHLVSSQEEMYVPVALSNKLDCYNLNSCKIRQVSIEKIQPFNENCTSLLLPDGSLCVIGSATSPTLVQRIEVKALQGKVYPSMIPDEPFKSYTYFDNKLYAVGGGNESKIVAVLDLISKKWSYLGSLRTPCYGAASLQSGEIVSIQKLDQQFEMCTIDVRSKKWTYSSPFESQAGYQTGFPIFVFSVESNLYLIHQQSVMIISNTFLDTEPLSSPLLGSLCSSVNLCKNCLVFSLKPCPKMQYCRDNEYDSRQYQRKDKYQRSSQEVGCYSWNLSTQSLSSVRFSK
jgi:hypothetical protein